MIFKLEFKMDSDAFSGREMFEIAAILRRVANYADNLGMSGEGPVRDTNGNTVGQWSIEESGVQS